ncbi:MAG: ATP-binding protein [Bacteroidota bacterium]|nr:ATP-binding protein [Bacteroidota bacterium]
MRSSIQIKMLVLLLCMGIIFSTGLIILKAFENNRITVLLKGQKAEQSDLLAISIGLMGNNLEAFTSDYSLWDEMVSYVKRPNSRWESENITPALATFNANAIWIFSPSLRLVSLKTRAMKDSLYNLPVSDKKFIDLLNKNKFYHFFIPFQGNLVMEVYGASIHPSMDTLRLQAPSGYLFTGRIWSKEYLKRISNLIRSEVELNPRRGDKASTEGSVTSYTKLCSFDGKVISTVKSKKDDPIHSKLDYFAKLQFYSILIFTILLLLFSSIFLYFTVNYPLRLISKSLRSELPQYMSKLLKKKDEFGQLSLLIVQFFKQKKELLDEITERTRIENELREIKGNLETLVNERTIDLNKANERLKNEIVKIKAVEDELRIAKEKAEESSRLKTEFLEQMSHEIRSPINTMLNFISLIKEEFHSPLNEDMKFSFNAIDSSSRRIIRTIDMILSMSEIKTGSFECNYKKINIEKEVLNNLINEFSSLAALKQLKLSVISNTEIPLIIGDLYTVNQIFVNLVDNAIKYTNHGEINIQLYKTDNGSLCVDVRDTGIGMSKEFLEKLFTPFSQEEQGYRRKFEGNGLGLALVKKYCEFNNAVIMVRSEKNAGSTFSVKFKEIVNNDQSQHETTKV